MKSLEINGVKNRYIMIFVAILIATILFTVLAVKVAQTSTSDDLYDNITTINQKQTILNNSGSTITLITTNNGNVYGLSSIKKNRTWLSFDGTNDYGSVPYNFTIAYWFKNNSQSWIHIINSSGVSDTIYVNGLVNTTWNYFPIYSNGSNWILGKSDGSTFEDVEIDKIDIYNEWINVTKATQIYEDGR